MWDAQPCAYTNLSTARDPYTCALPYHNQVKKMIDNVEALRKRKCEQQKVKLATTVALKLAMHEPKLDLDLKPEPKPKPRPN